MFGKLPKEFCGPWNLYDWNQTQLFDLTSFIQKAETGVFDNTIIGENHKAPWYQQLKQDVNEGLYDPKRMIEHNRVYQQWKQQYKDASPKLFYSTNLWTFLAAKTCNWTPIKNWNAIQLLIELEKNPNEGWR